MSSSPVKEVTFGSALKISLDNYYDLLKSKIGNLNTEEYLQLKLVADSLDLSDKPFADKGYRWFSHYNLLRRADRAIDPGPIANEVSLSILAFTSAYGTFLRRLRRYVVQKNLSPADQQLVADFDTAIESLKYQAEELAMRDRARWREVAEALGYSVTDMAAYIQWSSNSGNLRRIEAKIKEVRDYEFKKKTILDKTYPEVGDREIVEAEFAFENAAMRLRYPIFPDFEYSNGGSFSLEYLALLPLGSTALFDDRLVCTFDRSLSDIIGNTGGGFSATLSSSTSESKSIETDWKVSGSGRKGLFKVKASASDYRKISEDFVRGQSVTLSAKAVFRVGIQYAGWFKPQLFSNPRVLDNIRDFQDLLGPAGTLRYYPTAMIVVRGFSSEFTSSAAWTYDYKRNFSASAGGGFGIGGISFGASGSYSQNQKEHIVDQSGTKLTIADHESTLRFVGYVVQQNTVFDTEVIAGATRHGILGP